MASDFSLYRYECFRIFKALERYISMIIVENGKFEKLMTGDRIVQTEVMSSYERIIAVVARFGMDNSHTMYGHS